MNEGKHCVVSWCCSVFSSTIAHFQIENVEEFVKIIYVSLCALSVLCSLISTIKVWYDKAKQDGKITKEELQEGAQIVKEHVEQIENLVDKEDKNNGKDTR